MSITLLFPFERLTNTCKYCYLPKEGRSESFRTTELDTSIKSISTANFLHTPITSPYLSDWQNAKIGDYTSVIYSVMLVVQNEWKKINRLTAENIIKAD